MIHMKYQTFLSLNIKRGSQIVPSAAVVIGSLMVKKIMAASDSGCSIQLYCIFKLTECFLNLISTFLESCRNSICLLQSVRVNLESLLLHLVKSGEIFNACAKRPE